MEPQPFAITPAFALVVLTVAANLGGVIAVLRVGLSHLKRQREEDQRATVIQRDEDRRAWQAAREEDRRARDAADAESHRLMHALHGRVDVYEKRLSMLELAHAKLDDVPIRVRELEQNHARLDERVFAGRQTRRSGGGATD